MVKGSHTGIHEKRHPAGRISGDAGDENSAGNGDVQDAGSSGFDRDMETLEAMDLEKVTDKIRIDCKDRIQQLDLEYLLER